MNLTETLTKTAKQETVAPHFSNRGNAHHTKSLTDAVVVVGDRCVEDILPSCVTRDTEGIVTRLVVIPNGLVDNGAD